jgi:hypothetical protein
MKDLNIMDYIISILEHMIKKKQHYASKTVADFVLEYAVCMYVIAATQISPRK